MGQISLLHSNVIPNSYVAFPLQPISLSPWPQPTSKQCPILIYGIAPPNSASHTLKKDQGNPSKEAIDYLRLMVDDKLESYNQVSITLRINKIVQCSFLYSSTILDGSPNVLDG